MFTPDEYYNIVEFTGAGTRRGVCHGSSPPGLLRIFGTHAEQYAH